MFPYSTVIFKHTPLPPIFSSDSLQPRTKLHFHLQHPMAKVTWSGCSGWSRSTLYAPGPARAGPKDGWRGKMYSGEIIIFHQPGYPWNSRGFPFQNATFWEKSVVWGRDNLTRWKQILSNHILLWGSCSVTYHDGVRKDRFLTARQPGIKAFWGRFHRVSLPMRCAIGRLCSEKLLSHLPKFSYSSESCWGKLLICNSPIFNAILAEKREQLQKCVRVCFALFVFLPRKRSVYK